ncbi:hypothetical protein J437_LFUL009451 [Ladona fulva]|uniref:FAST kinase leucine-rich domain-containing protein n=1 Tax=Ladona fulva TaxID=123851 RepID=A0A8K0KD96_LADFU|nr:hypothetical protein J437_LFUL009451 [Ladona fulva]
MTCLNYWQSTSLRKMVCCFTRGAFLRQFPRSYFGKFHVKCLSNRKILLCIVEKNWNVANRYSTAAIGAAKLLTCENISLKCKSLVCKVHERCGNETDSDTEEVDELDPSATLEGKVSVHDILSSDAEDPIIIRLKSSANIQDVFDTVLENEENIRGIHLAHAILSIWDLQVASLSLSATPYNVESQQLAPESFITYIASFPELKKFVDLLLKNIANMSPDALACSALYLGKLGFGEVVDSQSNCMESVHECITKLFQQCEFKLEELNLTALSRFLVAMRVWNSSSPSSYNCTVDSVKVKNKILDYFQDCADPEDLRLLTISLSHIRPCGGFDVLQKFRNLVEGLISSGVIGPKDSRAVVRAATFLNLPHWSHLNITFTRSLLLLLKGNISSLTPADLVLVNRIVQSQLEPANLLTEIRESASKLLNDKDKTVPIIDLLACLVHSVQPSHKKRFEEATLDFIRTSLNTRLLPVTFKVIRHLKTSNIDLCNTFWSSTLAYIERKPRLQEPHRLLRFCHWYMHFNNNLGGTYRHFNFETAISEIISRNIFDWTNPSWIIRASSFLIAYGRISHSPELVLKHSERLFDNLSNLSPDDCLFLSHGLNIALNLGRGSRVRSKSYLWNFPQLARSLDRWSEEQMGSDDLILRSINVIARGYIERRSFYKRTSIFPENLAKCYEEMVVLARDTGETNSLEKSNVLSSRSVRDISANMLGGDWLLPKAADCLAEYIVKEEPSLSGEVVERVIQNFFLLNHYPKSADKFFESATGILFRDKERVPGLSLLQASLGFCYFQGLPSSLINYIFAVEFLERLDNEICHCYAKVKY